MSLIKDTLPNDEDLKNLNLNRTTAFKNPIQMLVANGSKKSVVFPINKLEKPSLDSVLNTVPLFYNPITKQLILQQDLEHQLNNNKINSTITSFNCNKFNKTSFNNKKCEIRLNDKNRPNLDKEIKKLNNLNKNDEFSNNCLKEEKKLLETQLDDFTTKSINLSQRPIELNNKDKIVNNCKILNNNHQSLLNKLSDKSLDNKSLNNNLNNNKCELNNKIELNNKCENQLKEEQTSINQIKKDTYKTHRRTPSYIHDFHNLIKNNNSTNHHQIKSSPIVNKITVSSAAVAIQNLTKTSLANLTSTLSSTINSTAKLNDHQMNSPIITNSNLDTKTTSSQHQQFTNKQIVFNETKNEFYDQDTDSDGSVFLNNSHNNYNLKNNKYSIDDDNIEPLNLPSPFGVEKSKKLSFLTEPIQSVLNKLTKTSISSNSSSLNSSNCTNNQTAKPQNTATNFFQSFNLNSNNERRNSKNLEISTTGLILENRPVGLEPKNKDEELQHREQYEQMLKEVKRKDEKQNKKNLIKKKKDEERMLNAIKIWKYEIIPNFDQVKHTKKVKELWMQGLPSNLRGQIWSLAIGNKLNLTENSLNEYLSKWYDSKLEKQLELDETLKENNERIENCLSKCSDENIYELIKLDVSRTYPNLKLFQKDAPFHNLLLKVLGSYVIAYKPNVGYIQGMSFLLGMFLLNMKPESAFIAFANLLETSPLLMSFMNVDQIKMENFYKSFDVYFNLYLPELYQHFKQQKLNTELFMINWVNTLFTKTLPLDISTRIWDLLFKDGEQIIVKTSLTLLKLYEKELLQLDFISSAQFLTQLNANNFTIDNNKFFNELNNFNLKPVTINKKIKCKNFYSVYEHFCNNSTNINSFS